MSFCYNHEFRFPGTTRDPALARSHPETLVGTAQFSMQKRAIFCASSRKTRISEEAYPSTPHKGIRSLTTKLPKSAVSGRELARISHHLAITAGDMPQSAAFSRFGVLSPPTTAQSGRRLAPRRAHRPRAGGGETQAPKARRNVLSKALTVRRPLNARKQLWVWRIGGRGWTPMRKVG
jgi:hypothetical protein